MKLENKEMAWKMHVNCFKSPIFRKGFYIIFGIFASPIVFILIMSLISGGFDSYAIYAISFMGVILVAFALVSFLYFRSYEVGYILNEEGIAFYTPEVQYRKNTILNTMVIILALLSKKPAMMSSGLISQNRQSLFIRWKDIKEIRFYPDSKNILVKAGLAKKVDVFCGPENYELVKGFMCSMVNEGGKIKIT